MDVLLSLAAGLGLRVYLIRATSPTSLVAPAALGIWEGILVHHLSFHPPPAVSSPPLDHYLALGLRLAIEFLITGNRWRVVMIALWAAIGTIVSESLFPSLSASFNTGHRTSSGRRDHEKRHRHSRTVPSHIPSHIRMYKEPEESPPPLPVRAPTQPTIQVDTNVTHDDQVLMSPSFPPTPPSFFLHAEAEPSPFPDSPASPKHTMTTTIISSIPVRPSSALAFYEGEAGVSHKPSGGQSLRSPNLPTPPDSTFRERTMDSRVDHLSTIDEITSRSEHVSEDVEQAEAEGEENYILVSHGGGVPLPIPNSTSHYVHADDATPVGSTAPSGVSSGQTPTIPLPIAPAHFRPRTPSDGGDELRTPGQPVYDIDPASDPDELTTPPALRPRADEDVNDEELTSTPHRRNGLFRPDNRLSPLMLDTRTVAPDPEPIPIPGTTLSSYAILQTPAASVPLGPVLDVMTRSVAEPRHETGRPSSPSNESVAESVLSTSTPAKTLQRAVDLRLQANKEEKERDQLKMQLALAISEKRGRDALILKGKIQEAEERVNTLHRKASRRHFAGRNDKRKPDTIDVHGLKPREALQKTEEALRDLLSSGQSTLKVIVGKGLHSKEGVPVLKNHIMREMREMNIPCKPDHSNAGILILTLSSINKPPNDAS